MKEIGMPLHKIEEGDSCLHEDCNGTYEFQREEGRSCSCHINPPCSACMDMELVCNKCGEFTELDSQEP